MGTPSTSNQSRYSRTGQSRTGSNGVGSNGVGSNGVGSNGVGSNGVGSNGVDLRPYATPVRDQGQESSCTGFAETAALELMLGIELCKPISYQLSPAYLYWKARQASNWDRLDDGAQFRCGLGVLTVNGVCDEMLMPYQAGQYDTIPSSEAEANAYLHKIRFYESISTSTDVMTSVLQSRTPILVNIPIYESFYNNNGISINVPTMTKFYGNHAVLIVGYINGYYIVKNSWGSDWCRSGYCYLNMLYPISNAYILYA